MKYILLCGGSGKRLESTNGFPKPLNMVLGIHSIQRVVESIPSDEIYIFMNKDLQDVQFHNTLHHLVKKTFHYIYLDRPTRGAIETAYLGLQKSNIGIEEPICFFDNDTIYTFNSDLKPETAIGYSKVKDDRPYCFLKIEDGKITDIAEKIHISDTYACGVYSFQTRKQFEDSAYYIMYNDITFNDEFYMSLIYKNLITNGVNVLGFEIPKAICLGTPDDISNNLSNILPGNLRICFDIDNTLFTYRQPGETYLDCKPIERVLFLLKELKSLGHTIILYTARGMKTYNNDLGKVMKANAQDTFETLDKYNVPYDEIYFGKPQADIYIDDRAFNPYINLFNSIGFSHLTEKYARSKIPESSSNKFNVVYRNGNEITKKGPPDSMNGEIFFYRTIQNTPLSSLFPTFIDGSPGTLRLKFVDGFTLFDILKDKLLSPKHIRNMVVDLDRMHNYTGIPVTIAKEDVYNNYMGKLIKRIQNKNDYPFDNTEEVVKIIDSRVKSYILNENTVLASVVHGDAWFSNTLMTKQGTNVFLDMKGDIFGKLTTNGDSLTDFGKMYQSILGFDCILNGIEQDVEYMDSLKSVFLKEVLERGFSIEDLNSVTACLIAKTLSFLSVDIKIREKIWNIVENLIK